MDSRLLEILVCAKCKGSLKYEPQGARLSRSACRLHYPIRDEIPVMLIDEAQSF